MRSVYTPPQEYWKIVARFCCRFVSSSARPLTIAFGKINYPVYDDVCVPAYAHPQVAWFVAKGLFCTRYYRCFRSFPCPPRLSTRTNTAAAAPLPTTKSNQKPRDRECTYFYYCKQSFTDIIIDLPPLPSPPLLSTHLSSLPLSHPPS